jgi:RNA polymerase sigma-70 factor, ECF subfamily
VTESELLEQVAAGDEDALEQLHFMFSAQVYALAWRMLRVREEAEEVLQDTFVHIYRSAASHGTRVTHTNTNPRAFVYTIARNLCLSRLRARTARPIIALDLGVDAIGFEPETHSSDVLDRVMVRTALTRLSVDERSLLEAAYFDGWSHSELVDRTGLPLGTVKAKLRRGLLKLRGILERTT